MRSIHSRWVIDVSYLFLLTSLLLLQAVGPYPPLHPLPGALLRPPEYLRSFGLLGLLRLLGLLGSLSSLLFLTALGAVEANLQIIKT